MKKIVLVISQIPFARGHIDTVVSEREFYPIGDCLKDISYIIHTFIAYDVNNIAACKSGLRSTYVVICMCLCSEMIWKK
jgi:hypothetical protein